MRFWDSSAIIPLLVRQPSSGRVDAWFAADPEVGLWTLTSVEITSALWRLVRERSLSEAVALEADARGAVLVASGYVVVDVEAVKGLAQRLLRVHSLRAADALHLGAALVWAAGRPQERTLHTLDQRLATAARREGFTVPV